MDDRSQLPSHEGPPASEAPPKARRSAKPTPGRGVPGELFAARLAKRTSPAGARTITQAPRTGSADEIAAHKRTLLVTFRRNGVPVATPVWAAQDGDCFYTRGGRTAGKIKRLRNDSRVLIAPCTVRGRPLGAPLEAHASMVPPEREHIAEQALVRRYGLGRALFEWAMDRMGVDMCYLEIVPGAWSSGAPASKSFRVRPQPMGVRPGVNLDKASSLASEMEDAEIVRKMKD